MKNRYDNAPGPADLLGRRLARQLDEGAGPLAPDITERLRFARERAVARARQAQALQPQAATAPWAWGMSSAPVAAAGGGGAALNLGPGLGSPQWSSRLVSLLPLFILLLGFLVIQDLVMESQIEAAAEVDAALLADDLPPQAYSDPGFAEFLRRHER